MDSEIIRAVQNDKQNNADTPVNGSGEDLQVSKISDDLYKGVITPLKNEFSDPIVAPHWWKKPAEDFKGFAEKTRINNTIWRQWYVHFVRGKETVVKFANPIPLADKYHARVLAVVVEGHYWCRKHSAIRAQYSSWRNKVPTKKRDLPKKTPFDNLVVKTTSSYIQEDPNICSPGMDDLVLSGMFNGFGDLNALDLQLELPDFLKPDFFPSLPPLSANEAPSNGASQPTHYPPEPTATTSHQLDTTSLNTLATAANMSQYYGSSSEYHLQYRGSGGYPQEAGSYPEYGGEEYRGAAGVPPLQPAPYTEQYTSLEQPPPPPPSYGADRDPSYPESDYPPQPPPPLVPATSDRPFLPAPKGPAYYPPTRLQYCYSSASNTQISHPGQFSYTTPGPGTTTTTPGSGYRQGADQYGASTDAATSQPVYKQKLSEIEIDRKRRRVMKDRLQNLKDIIPPCTSTPKSTHAAVLINAAHHLRTEEAILTGLEADISRLNILIEQTKLRITEHQILIPENGISSACFGSGVVEMQYACFLEEQSSINPLMKVYSTLLEPLFTSFNSMVDNTSLDSFCKTAHQWFAQNCSLTRLRELATNLVTSPKLEFDVPPGPSGNNS